MKVLDSARKKMLKQVVPSRLEIALARNVSLVAERDIKLGDAVLMIRERPNSKRVCPYVLFNRMEDMLSFDTGDRVLMAFVDKAKIYREHKPGIKSHDDAKKEDPRRHTLKQDGNPGNNEIPGSIDALNKDISIQTTGPHE